MKTYTCIFPGLYNYILTKDVGMIPYILTNYYDTNIVTYDNDSYYYTKTLLKSLKINYLENTGNEKKDVIKYLKKNAKNIDIIQFYHLRYNLLPYYILVYKIHNRKGKIYLKLDANNEVIDFLTKRKGILPNIRRHLTHILFKCIDVISIETKQNFKSLEESKIIDSNKLLYLPNGIIKTSSSITNKEKIILYVGHIEKKNKSIDLLLESIKNIDLNGWKIVLIGEVKEDMNEFLNNYFKENPLLKNKIIFKGYISNKKTLSQEYSKSSIYICVSSKESFGISTLEAGYHGNYILSTNVGGSPDIIEKTNYGKIIEHNTVSIKENITYTINNWENIKEDPIKIQNIIYESYNWNYLCNQLNETLQNSF